MCLFTGASADTFAPCDVCGAVIAALHGRCLRDEAAVGARAAVRGAHLVAVVVSAETRDAAVVLLRARRVAVGAAAVREVAVAVLLERRLRDDEAAVGALRCLRHGAGHGRAKPSHSNLSQHK